MQLSIILRSDIAWVTTSRSSWDGFVTQPFFYGILFWRSYSGLIYIKVYKSVTVLVTVFLWVHDCNQDVYSMPL